MDTAYTTYAYEYATAAEAVGANTYAYNFLYAPSEEFQGLNSNEQKVWKASSLMNEFSSQNHGKY